MGGAGRYGFVLFVQAHLLLLFLDSLPEPLLPAYALARARSVGKQQDKAQLQATLDELPPHPRSCFVRLTQLLGRVLRTGVADRTNAVRLARVLAPYITRSKAEESSLPSDPFVEFVVMAIESALEEN